MSLPTNDPAALRIQVLAYLKNELSDEDKAFFETMLAESEELRQELSQSRALLEALQAADDAPAQETVNSIIRDALQKGVSDIHLEPGRQGTRVRFRIDGFLHNHEMLPRETFQAVVDRWKVMAEMNVAERRLPQTGRLPVKHDGKDYELRVSILPSLYGEKVVARILSQDSVLIGLDNLNLSPAPLDALKRLATLRDGLIIATGSIGSGKTTILYSLLQEIQRQDSPRVITTIEDPIEYVLGEGVTQTATNRKAGLTTAAALRAALRSDSDVIYISSTYDRETAEIEVEAAQAGALVLTALGTGSTLGAVQRLRDMGVDNFLIADSVKVLVGQRLLRRIDVRQTEEYEPDLELLNSLGLSQADGPFHRGIPSDANNNTGFVGRIPLTEVIEVGDKLRRAIVAGASYEEMRNIVGENSSSLREDARAKVRAGLTTAEEVNRVLFPAER